MKLLVQLLTMWIILVFAATVAALLARRLAEAVVVVALGLAFATLALFIKGTDAPIAFLLYTAFSLIGGSLIGLGFGSQTFMKLFDIRSAIGAFVLPLTFAIMLALPASDLLHGVGRSDLEFIKGLSPLTLVGLGAIEVLLIAAAFYWLRCLALRFYATLEIAIGIIGIVLTLWRMPLERLDPAYLLGCLSAIYVIVRGLDNLSKSSFSSQGKAPEILTIPETES